MVSLLSYFQPHLLPVWTLELLLEMAVSMLRYPTMCPVCFCAKRSMFENLYQSIDTSDTKVFVVCFPS